MIELESNIDAGLALLPDGIKYQDDIDWYSIYLGRADLIQDAIVDLWNQLIEWPIPQAPTWTWLLEAIGKLLGQARPDGASNEVYRTTLAIRRLARQSTGTRPDVIKVVDALGNLGSGARVDFLIPHTVVVSFANFSELDEQGVTLDIVSDLLLDSIGDVDRLQIWDAVGNVFSWDVEGAGWLQAVWATPLFDSGS